MVNENIGVGYPGKVNWVVCSGCRKRIQLRSGSWGGSWDRWLEIEKGWKKVGSDNRTWKCPRCQLGL